MTTTPTASPELSHLDHLEALARAATPGPCAYQEDSDVYTHIARPVQSPGNIVRHYAQDTSGVVEANARFTAGANPAAVLALIALARRAQPEGEAPQAEPSKLYVEARECSSCLHVGINDSSDTLAACHSCDWNGPSPAEDHCPGCDQDGCMGAACPKCGAIYKLLAETNIAATLSPLCGAQHAESGNESIRQHEAIEAAVDQWYPKRDSPHASVNDKIGAVRLAFRKGYRAALAAQQAAAPGSLDWVNDVVRDVAELPDRDSLPGREDMMLVTVNELHDIIERHAPSAPGTPEAPKTAAARDVLAERQRQVEQEGWTPAHDDAYVDGQLASAAVAYAQAYTPYLVPSSWPWAVEWFKAGDDRRNMVKAGALILAEIERLDRAAQLDGGQEGSESNG